MIHTRYPETTNVTDNNKASVWGTKPEIRARVGRPQTSWSPPVILLLAIPRQLFCFGSFVVLDVVFRYLSLFLLYITIEIGKNRC